MIETLAHTLNGKVRYKDLPCDFVTCFLSRMSCPDVQMHSMNVFNKLVCTGFIIGTRHLGCMWPLLQTLARLQILIAWLVSVVAAVCSLLIGWFYIDRKTAKGSPL